ncbi:MAG TPA: hypothetical protein DCX06_11445 [Opitutae bacterium]|nr:hypothetical protein [Opitutae bacterium]
MKTKTLIIASAAALTALSSANAGLVAGWDFSQYVGPGFNSTNGADFTGEGNAQANYSDFSTPSPDIAAGSFGSIYFDGSFGSTDAVNGFTYQAAPVSGNLTSSNIQTADLNPFNDLGSYALLTNSGQSFTNDLSLGIDDNISVVFAANVTGQGAGADDWTLNFAAMDSLNTSTVSWEISTDGSNYTSLGLQSSLTTTDSGFSVTSALADGSDQVFFRGTFADIELGTSRAVFDNVGISGTVVPEPSMFAAIAGVVALGFASLRRRRA